MTGSEKEAREAQKELEDRDRMSKEAEERFELQYEIERLTRTEEEQKAYEKAVEETIARINHLYRVDSLYD